MHVKCSSFHRQFFPSFHHRARLYHLEYWLAGRHRHLLSLLKAEPFKILKTSATMGQKVVALQATKADRLLTVSDFPTREKPLCAFVTLPPELSTAESHYYARFFECLFCTDKSNFIILPSSHEKINNYFMMYAVANLLWGACDNYRQ